MNSKEMIDQWCSIGRRSCDKALELLVHDEELSQELFPCFAWFALQHLKLKLNYEDAQEIASRLHRLAGSTKLKDHGFGREARYRILNALVAACSIRDNFLLEMIVSTGAGLNTNVEPRGPASEI